MSGFSQIVLQKVQVEMVFSLSFHFTANVDVSVSLLTLNERKSSADVLQNEKLFVTRVKIAVYIHSTNNQHVASNWCLIGFFEIFVTEKP